MSFLKKRKGLVAILVVVAFLYIALSFARSVFLKQLGRRLDQSFEVGELKLSYLPPSLSIKNLKSKTDNPRFSVASLKVSLSFLSLLKKEKPVTVEVYSPELFYDGKSREAGDTRKDFSLNLPLVIESGYINDGHFSFELKQGSYELSSLSAFFRLEANRLNLLLRADASRLRPYDSPEVLEGELETLITSRGRTINIGRLTVQGENSALRLEGKIALLEKTVVDLRAVYNLDTSFIMAALDLPFEWSGKTSGQVSISNQGGPLLVKTDYLTRDFRLNRVDMGSVEGQVVVEKGRGGQILAEVKKNGRPTEKVVITYGGGKIEGQMSGFHLDPIMNYASVPWPVESPAWGRFSLSQGELQATAEFRDRVNESEVKDRHRLNGPVEVNLHLKNKDLKIQTKDLQTSFGRLTVSGRVVIGQTIDLGITGQFSDVRGARQFTERLFQTEFDFPEIRGEGRAEIEIKGDYHRPRLNFEFSLSPAGFERFQVTTARGRVAVEGGEVEGKVYVLDKNFEGQIDLKTSDGRTETRMSLQRALVETVLDYLKVNFPVRGSVSGDFVYLTGGGQVDFQGDFASEEMFLLGSPIRKVSGRIIWNDRGLSFPELRFNLNGGEVAGRLTLGYTPASYDFDLKATGVDLQPFSADFSGRISLDLKGRGIFGQDRPAGKFSIDRFGAFFIKAQGAAGDYNLNFLDNQLSLELRGRLLPGDSDFGLKLEIPFDRDFLAGEVKGRLTNLDLLLPWKGASGSVDYLLSFQGPIASIDLSGAVELRGNLIPIPGFAHALNDFSGLAFVKNGRVSIRSFQGVLGGGPVQGSGELSFGETGLSEAEIRMSGQNMELSVFERTRLLADGQMRFLKKGSRSVLEGDFLLKEALWKKELYEKLSFSSQVYNAEGHGRWIDDLNLNFRLQARDNVWMENSLGRIRARLDLTISGTVGAPVVTGEIEALSGTVYFQDRDFRVLRGRLSFFNPLVIDPYIDFQGETYVKDYHVIFSLSGLASSLKPEFSSSPPLPTEEILSLLALGESYQRRYSLDPTQMSTASMISYQLARKSESLFSLDRFRLDPFLMGSTSEITARLTVGKRLSKNFFIVYSTNLATQREEIVRLEWELSGGLSLVAIRNELGRVSLDVKLRRRF
ncbi:MAG: translocation/assembly module TamB domain-containing protein [Candidatus Saccharicenans sp.]|nr:translocation/assembly module TamB domain-containing protein [Candidatus Saccharicenans sp.]